MRGRRNAQDAWDSEGALNSAPLLCNRVIWRPDVGAG